MTPGQLAVVAFLLALGLLAIPAAALGWWAGRRALRLTLDPRMLEPVPHPETREPPTEPLPVAGRFPTDPVRVVWSEVQAGQAHLARHVTQLGQETEQEIHDMTVAASELIPARWR